MALDSLSRDELVDCISGVFREHGYEGASLAKLSDATGLVKASLYYQFPGGKLEMAEAVIEKLDQRMKDEVVSHLHASAASPRRRVERAMNAISDFYDGGRLSCAIDVLGIGVGASLFQQHLSRSIAAFGRHLSKVLQEGGVSAALAQARVEDALVAIQGALVVARATGSTRVFKRTISELPKRLFRGV